jgi:hypothetical protein
VDRGKPAEKSRGADFRVGLPRGKLRHREHSERSPRQGKGGRRSGEEGASLNVSPHSSHS